MNSHYDSSQKVKNRAVFENQIKTFQLQYNENPEDFNSEVEAFAKLRNTSCVYINSSNTELALDNMEMYYCQLAFFKNRFQILESPLMKKGPFDFPWTDVVEDPLNPFAMSMHADLESEMAIVFYNIGKVLQLFCTLFKK